MKFGDKLRQARQRHGLTQEELSFKLGITCRTLQNYESGNVYPKKRELYTRLAEFFSTDVNYWLSESREEQPAQKKTRHEEINVLASRASSIFEEENLTEDELDRLMRLVQRAYWSAKDKNRQGLSE